MEFRLAYFRLQLLGIGTMGKFSLDQTTGNQSSRLRKSYHQKEKPESNSISNTVRC